MEIKSTRLHRKMEVSMVKWVMCDECGIESDVEICSLTTCDACNTNFCSARGKDCFHQYHKKRDLSHHRYMTIVNPRYKGNFKRTMGNPLNNQTDNLGTK